jgi:5-methylcytosine-specific restriction endonuclease McrA
MALDTTEYLDRKFASGKLRKCWMCGCVLTRGTASVDHLQPQSKGGNDRADNFRLACKPCNSARGNKVLPRAQQLALRGKAEPRGRDFTALAQAIQRARHE